MVYDESMKKGKGNPIGYEDINKGKKSYKDYLLEAYGPLKVRQMTMPASERNRLAAQKRWATNGQLDA